MKTKNIEKGVFQKNNIHLFLGMSLAVMLLFAGIGVTSATVTYSGGIIYISDGIETIGSINTALSDPSLLQQLSPKEWLLKVPIQVQSTGSLYINDTDCDWLKLLSNTGNDAYILNYGTLEISDTKITSWNTNTDAPVPKLNTRGDIRSDSGSTINIYNSNLSYLGYESPYNTGVVIKSANGSQVINSTFDHNYDGIAIWEADNFLIKDCKAHYNYRNGIMLVSDSAINATIDSCYVTGSDYWDGIHVEADNGIVLVVNCTVKDVNNDAIHVVSGSRYVTIENCTVIGYCHCGIDLHNSVTHCTVKNCIVHDCTGDNGIYMHNYGSDNNLVTGCTVYNSKTALKVSGSVNNTAKNCTFYNNTLGIEVRSGPHLFENCDFYNNRQDVSFYLGGSWEAGVWYPNTDNTFLRCTATDYQFYKTEHPHTIRDSQNDFTVNMVGSNTVIVEFTDGRTFKLDGDAGGHTSVTLTTVGTHTIEIEGVAATGNISGTVTDNNTGSGIEGATVTVEGPEKSAQTGSDGTYTINAMPVGTYTVTASATGYEDASKPNIVVNEGETTTVNFQLTKETIPPTITAHLPIGTDVFVGTPITVTFSEAMNKSSAEGAFSVSPSVTGSFSWDGDKMIFTPDSELDYLTTYTVNISTEAEDLAGNNLVEDYSWQFTTKEQDLTPPVISDVNATSISGSSAIITWETDEPASSLVKYGTSPGSYTQTKSNSSYVTSHSTTLAGLSSNTTYYFVVNSTDQSGNSNQSTEHNFTTKEEINLVAEWHFDENEGTSALDTSGNNNHGMIHGATWTTGKLGFALNFDGSNDYVEVPDSDSLDITEQVTFVAWIKPDSLPPWSAIVEKDNSFIFGTKNDELVWYLFHDYQTSSGLDLVTGVWQHVAITFDGSNLRFYKNGTSYTTTDWTHSISSSNNGVRIGTDRWNEFFDGILDEVYIYNRALSTEEIMAHYQARADTGTISGKVTNVTGVPIEGATVTANGYSNETNAMGGYIILNVPVGNYTVTASADGYEKASKNATVIANQTTVVNFTLNSVGESDIFPPTTTYNISPSPNEAGWNNVIPVVVMFSRSDNDGSGVSYTNLSSSGEITVEIEGLNHTIPKKGEGNLTIPLNATFGDSFNVTTSNEGITEIWYYSVDNNSNVEAAKNIM